MEQLSAVQDKVKNAVKGSPMLGRVVEKGGALIEKSEEIMSKQSDRVMNAARCLLVITFIEDSIRVFTQFDSQSSILMKEGFPYSVAAAYLLLSSVVQIASSIMVVMKKHTQVSVFCLIGSLIGHILVYGAGHLMGSIRFPPFAGVYLWLLSNLAVIGGLLMLLAQEKRSKSTVHSAFVGMPLQENKELTRYLQLFGRLLICTMFLLMSYNLRFSQSYVMLKRLAFAIPPLLILVGFKTRYATILLVLVLFTMNFSFNAFWSFNAASTRDIYKYYMFLNFSVMGGLLLLVSLGPGSISIDEKKKQY
eukprot:TRINITY_DN8488_c0_g1::TRINITY_DN8488_c0_g1_i1::g.3471::m.3471 TRINITY_DN8488_c0_g1::TRINITY_DN8488_c0_g1_i1::g.3471  ORF type:complete len:318 (-),score=109.02,sp/O18405/SURF4_DROME/29.96/4e-30,SURF4/PF02077.10/1.2e-52,DoxX/PF07681.7/0.085,DoxX/PF07681.7/2.3e+03,DoxX/PF07681.7/1.2e+03,DoxX/PF07681.7/3.7,DoxX/PF07681.7/1.2e+04 TRINITY_DN8488_c0_g1_i1:455-1372(-)